MSEPIRNRVTIVTPQAIRYFTKETIWALLDDHLGSEDLTDENLLELLEDHIFHTGIEYMPDGINDPLLYDQMEMS